MLTIFTNTRPFQGPFDLIQRNAIKSWLALRPQPEIILFEDEEKTTSKIAKEFNLKLITDCAHNEFGTSLLNDVFNKVRSMASNRIIAQVNADIILMSDFMQAIKLVDKFLKDKKFFMIGRRWDLDLNQEINFQDSSWENKLKEKVLKEGKRHGLSGLDYWVFPKEFDFNPPGFNIGRPGMDSWLIYRARSLKVPVIDATNLVNIIHQNHNYPKKKDPSFNVEKDRNLKLAGGYLNMLTLRDADYVLTSDGIEGPKFPMIIFPMLSLFYPWRILLSLKRTIEKRLSK